MRAENTLRGRSTSPPPTRTITGPRPLKPCDQMQNQSCTDIIGSFIDYQDHVPNGCHLYICYVFFEKYWNLDQPSVIFLTMWYISFILMIYGFVWTFKLTSGFMNKLIFLCFCIYSIFWVAPRDALTEYATVATDS